jgi:AcrR family transcriptional regulator
MKKVSTKKSNKQLLHMPDKLKERLHPAVLDLFSQKDFHQVQIREICKRSGLSPSTIYKYFASKEDLLFTLLDESIREIASLARIHLQGLESSREIFRKIFWVSMDYYDRNPGVAITAFITVPMRTWMKESSYGKNDFLAVAAELIQQGLKRNEIDRRVQPEQIRDLYYMYCHRQIQLWYYHGMKWKLVETIPRFFGLFWKTIAAPEDKRTSRTARKAS